LTQHTTIKTTQNTTQHTYTRSAIIHDVQGTKLIYSSRDNCLLLSG
jgi:hypothetical protein